MKRILGVFLALALFISLFAVNSHAFSFQMSLDAVEGGAVIGHGGANEIARARVTVAPGERVQLIGWLLSSVGMSKLQYSIDGGAWSDFSGAYSARTDVAAAYPEYFTNPALNTTPGFGTAYIDGTASLAEGYHFVDVRAVPQNGSLADAFRVMTVDLTVGSHVYPAAELTWALGNVNGTGEYTSEGYKTVTYDAPNIAWPVVMLPRSFNTAEYPFMVVSAKSDSGADVHVYSQTGAGTGLGTFVIGEGATVRQKFNITAVPTLESPTFPVVRNSDVTFTELAFFRSEAEADAYLFRFQVIESVCIDHLYLDNEIIHAYSGRDDGFTANFTDKAGSELMLRGWMTADHPIDAIGYQVDNREPVFEPEFKFAAEEAVINAGAAIAGTTGETTRYCLTLPVERGSHTVRMVARFGNLESDFNYLAWTFSYTDNETGILSTQVSVGADLTLTVRSLIPAGASPRMRFSRENDSLVVNGSYDSGTGTYIFRYTGIYTQCMTEPITIELLNGNSVAQTKTFTVRGYVDSVKQYDAGSLGMTAGQKALLDTLLADMLVFGAEAQKYKSYRTDDLADSPAWVNECKTVTDELPVSVKGVLVAGSASDKISFATLFIDNTIRLKVLATATAADRVVFSHGSANDTVMLTQDMLSGGYYEVLSAPITALRLDESFVISLMNGSTVLSRVSYSAYSYAVSMWNDQSLQGLMRSMFYYGRSARLYAEGSSGSGAADEETDEIVIYADSLKNGIQGYYENNTRSSFIIRNQTGSFRLGLVNEANKGLDKIYDSAGRLLLDGGMSAYAQNTGGTVYKSYLSASNGRVNTTQLGYYYYDIKFRDSSYTAGFKLYGETDLNTALSYATSISSSNPSTNMVTSVSGHTSLPSSGTGYYSATINDPADPYVSFSLMSTSVGSKDSLTFEFAYTGVASRGKLYYNTGNGYNEAQSCEFDIFPGGSFNRVVLRVPGITNQRLRGIRVDVNDGRAGDTFSIRGMKIIALRSSEAANVAFEQTFHSYSDKLNSEIRLLFSGETSAYSRFGYEYRIPSSSVSEIVFEDSAGVKNNVGYFAGDRLYYVGFDITGAGMLGFVAAEDGHTRASFTYEDGYYVVRFFVDVSGNHKAGTDVSFGHRIYTADTKDFEGLARASYEERHPLNVSIEQINGYSDFGYNGYDPVSGAYVFRVNGTSFNEAFFNNPNNYYGGRIVFGSDGTERKVYVRSEGYSGSLEGAVILDGDDMLLPVAAEVCKNFTGEFEERFYDPNDTGYGNTYYPVVVPAEGGFTHTMLNLYQNWGLFRQKQLSSIQFHIGYYHLSTGVTESNCIAPYFVYSQDGWTLPDFRGCSGIMWSTQPQYASVGRPRFMTPYGTTRNEYTGSLIRSSGPAYADMDYSYTYADSTGAVKMNYTLRHVEFPQSDENRTYYTLTATVTQDFSISGSSFTLFSFDGRSDIFRRISYTNTSGTVSTISPSTTSNTNFSTYVLARNAPFVTLYNFAGEADPSAGIENFGFIVKDYSFVIGGQPADVNLCLREKTGTDGRKLNFIEIGINMGTINFRAGDTLKMDFVLLPYGAANQNNYDNVTAVVADSVTSPWRFASVTKGTAVADDWLAIVRAAADEAEFTVTGSRNANVVRVDGFSRLARPVIEEYVNGRWVPYNVAFAGYDGYQVTYDGATDTYGYAFVVMMDNPAQQRTFRVRG